MLFNGMRKQVWPKENMYTTIMSPSTAQPTDIAFNEHLVQGANYFVHATAINQAYLSTSHESNGVTIDSTPPEVSKVNEMLQFIFLF